MPISIGKQIMTAKVKEEDYLIPIKEWERNRQERAKAEELLYRTLRLDKTYDEIEFENEKFDAESLNFLGIYIDADKDLEFVYLYDIKTKKWVLFSKERM